MRLLTGIIMWCMAAVCHGAVYHVEGTLTGDNGLPHYQVNSIAKDAKGYVWVGTRNGLSRYDGYGVKNYFHSDENPNSLRHNYVRKVFVDSSNRMWLLTVHGLSRYDADTDRFINYANLNSDFAAITETPDGRIVCGGAGLFVYDADSDRFRKLAFGSEFILSLASDRKGNIYLSTNEAIYRLDPGMKTARLMPRHLYEGVTTGAGDIIPLLTDSDNNLWIGRNGDGVTRYSLTNGRTDVIDAEKLPHGLVRTLAEDADGNILAGTGKGVAIIEADSSKVAVSHRLDNLDNNSVYAVMADSDRNVWAGTYFGGITIMSARNNRFTHYNGENSGMKGNVVRMMTKPTPGQLWIATEDGGINILDMESGKMTPFTAIGQTGNNIHSLCFDKEHNRMWIGTFLHGLFRYDLATGEWKRYLLTNGLDSNSVFYLAQTPDGTLHVATPRGMRVYDPATDRFNCVNHPRLDWTFVYTFLPDSAGNLWVGTTTEGLFRIDRKSGEIEVWAPDGPEERRLVDKFVTSLCLDHNGKLWVGTNNSGMQILNSDGTVYAATSDNRTICAITCDKEGYVWVTTSTGLFKYASDGTEIASYTTDNGLPTNQMNLSSVYRASDGKIYAGTINGLVSFNPRETQPDAGMPEVRLSALWANGNEIHPADSTGLLPHVLDNVSEITLPQSQCRTITLEYGVVMPGTPHNVAYQVMLEGSDKYWRNVGQERKVSFFNLSPGNYTLHIRASNASNEWDDMPVKSIGITVKPPFYRSTAAMIAYAMILTAPGIIIWRRKRRVAMAAATEESVTETDSDNTPAVTGNHVEREFMAALDKLVTENLSNNDFCVDHITSALGMSRTLLHNRIKGITGQSISEYIREKRFAEAERLLADGYNVSETAWRCGFGDPNHFSKMFKKRFGVSPSRYGGKAAEN